MKWLSQVRSLVATGALFQPQELLRRARFHREFAAVDKALFFHRYATILFLAQRHGLFDALSTETQAVASLAERIKLDVEPVETMLRILESQGWVDRSLRGVKLTAFGELFLNDETAYSGRPMLELMGEFANAYPQVEDALRTGVTPAALDVQNTNGSYRLFLSAVNNYLYWAGHELLQKATLPNIRSCIVGSMGVSFSAQLLRLFPAAKVTYGCLEHLVAEIPQLCQHYEVPPARITSTHTHGGDPQADEWGDESFDLVFLTRKMIVEPESEFGLRFARKAFDVLNPGGAVILWETVHPNRGKTPLPCAMEAVFDLTASPKAPSRTKKCFERLLSDVGFSNIEVVSCLGGQTSFVVGTKA